MKVFSITTASDQVLCDTPTCFAQVRHLGVGAIGDKARTNETVLCVVSGEIRLEAQRTELSTVKMRLGPMQGAQIPAGMAWQAATGSAGAKILRVDSPHPKLDPSERLLSPLREVHRFNVEHGEQLIYDDYVRGSVLTFAPDFAADKHFHQDADEIFWFFSGTCRVTSPAEDVILPEGSIVFTPANEWHIIANAGDTPLLMFLTVTPNIVPSHTFFKPDGTTYARSMEPLRQSG